MNGLSEESVICARAENLSSALGNEAVVLNMDSSRYYGLNSTGTFILQILQQPTRLGEVRQRICEIYDVSPEDCWTDLVRVIDEMLASGLVEVK